MAVAGRAAAGCARAGVRACRRAGSRGSARRRPRGRRTRAARWSASPQATGTRSWTRFPAASTRCPRRTRRGPAAPLAPAATRLDPPPSGARAGPATPSRSMPRAATTSGPPSAPASDPTEPTSPPTARRTGSPTVPQADRGIGTSASPVIATRRQARPQREVGPDGGGRRRRTRPWRAGTASTHRRRGTATSRNHATPTPVAARRGSRRPSGRGRRNPSPRPRRPARRRAGGRPTTAARRRGPRPTCWTSAATAAADVVGAATRRGTARPTTRTRAGTTGPGEAAFERDVSGVRSPETSHSVRARGLPAARAQPGEHSRPSDRLGIGAERGHPGRDSADRGDDAAHSRATAIGCTHGVV